MAINPNSAYVRIVFDMPTPQAIKLSEHLKAAGVSRIKYLNDLVARDIESKTKPTAKGKK